MIFSYLPTSRKYNPYNKSIFTILFTTQQPIVTPPLWKLVKVSSINPLWRSHVVCCWSTQNNTCGLTHIKGSLSTVGITYEDVRVCHLLYAHLRTRFLLAARIGEMKPVRCTAFNGYFICLVRHKSFHDLTIIPAFVCCSRSVFRRCLLPWVPHAVLTSGFLRQIFSHVDVICVDSHYGFRDYIFPHATNLIRTEKNKVIDVIHHCY